MKNRKKTSAVYILIITGFIMFHSSLMAQKSRKITAVSAQFKTALLDKDIDKLIDLYADSVLYTDPIYGSVNTFKKKELRTMFEPVLKKDSGFDFTVIAIAVDQEEGNIAIRAQNTAPNYTEKWKFTLWLKIKDGKISEQTDLIVYPPNELKFSPRYKHLFEDKDGSGK